MPAAAARPSAGEGVERGQRAVRQHGTGPAATGSSVRLGGLGGGEAVTVCVHIITWCAQRLGMCCRV